MRNHNVGHRDDVSVEITEEGHLKFYVPVSPAPVPRKTAQQRAVEQQLQERKKAVDAGQEVPGYVPPAKPKRKIRIPKQRNKKG